MATPGTVQITRGTDSQFAANTSCPGVDGVLGVTTDVGVVPAKVYVSRGGTWRLCGTSTSGLVSSFNTRTGAITLQSSDVVAALGFTPLSSLPNVGTAGAYAYPSSITTDAQGRVAGAVAGTIGTNLTASGGALAVVGSPTFVGTVTSPSLSLASSGYNPWTINNEAGQLVTRYNGAVVGVLNSGGNMSYTGVGVQTSTAFAAQQINLTPGASVAPLNVKLSAGQTANARQTLNSSGVPVEWAEANGNNHAPAVLTSVRIVTTSTSLLSTDTYLIVNSGTAATITGATLTGLSGHEWVVFNQGSGAVTLPTITGGPSTLATGKFARFFTDGTTLFASGSN